MKFVNYEKYIFVMRAIQKNILEFGSFGKEINKQTIENESVKLINVW